MKRNNRSGDTSISVPHSRQHPFPINIELHIEGGERRYRWNICESSKMRDRSSKSYAAMPEVQADTDKASAPAT